MKKILSKLLGRVGRREMFLSDKYPQYEIGRGSYGYLRVRNGKEGATLKIGAFCSFAGGVQIFLGGEHQTGWVTTFPFAELWNDVAGHLGSCAKTRGDVLIGNDVWIGTEALVMSGVRVGNGAVIGARSVVTRDVPPYAVVGGVPAKVIRMRFDDETIARLETLAWWDWDDSRVKRFIPNLLSGDVKNFLDLAEKEQKESGTSLEPKA